MVITKKKLSKLCQDKRWFLCRDLEVYILDYYKNEPYPYIWSEQDLYEQIRKLVLNDALNHKKEDTSPFQNPIQIE